MSWPESEQDVAEPMVDYLRHVGWEVFQEVPIPGGRADMVARREAGDATIYYCLEVKRRFGWKLLDTAIYRTPWFHYVAVVVPERKRGAHTSHAAKAVRRRYGLGLWTVQGPDRIGPRVKARWNAVLHRPGRPVAKVEENLYEAQKHYEAAGSASGVYWSPWKETCHRVREYVRDNPGCTVPDLLDAIDHHYRRDASFKRFVVGDVKKGKVAGVRLENGREYRFYPEAS